MFYQIKHQFNELMLFLKSNFLYHLFSMVILTLFLLISGIFFTLYTKANVQEKYIADIYDGKTFYDLKDSLYDPDQFYDYRHKKENIDKISDFYNALDSSLTIDFLSVFTQSIPIENFQGGSSFYYNSEAFRAVHPSMTANLKSLQLNQNAFDFYKIKLSHGENLPWENISYNNDEIPVLLGSEYSNLYNLGDSIAGKYYFRDINMIVKGFIAPNTFINYNGTPEFYLDQYLIVPYPATCKYVDKNNFEFEGILYFAMINGRLSTTLPKDELIYEIKLISHKTQFEEFSIIGLPELSSKYNELLSVINENQNLLNLSVFFLLALVIFIQYGIAHIILLKREDHYKNYWLIGYSPYKRIYMRDVSMPYIGAYVIANVLLGICFKRLSFLTLLFISIVTLSILIIIYIGCSKLFARKMRNIM